MHTRTGILTAAVIIFSAGALRAQDRPDLTIRLEHGNEAERIMARQLDSLRLKYDLEPWINEWIYERVLYDPRVRGVSVRNGFDVRESAHGR